MLNDVIKPYQSVTACYMRVWAKWCQYWLIAISWYRLILFDIAIRNWGFGNIGKKKKYIYISNYGVLNFTTVVVGEIKRRLWPHQNLVWFLGQMEIFSWRSGWALCQNGDWSTSSSGQTGIAIKAVQVSGLDLILISSRCSKLCGPPKFKAQ